MEPYFAARETLAHAEAEALAKAGRVLLIEPDRR